LHAEIRDDVIDIGSVVARVARPGAGGIDVFIGCVRDMNDGRDVVLLEYEAYVPMALAEMNRIGDEIERGTPDGSVRVAAAHRVGTLAVGDVAVICAASAPHRAEAFAACRALIDEIKHRVPIWKREHGPEGAYWVGWQDARCHHP
jgi:molybdopterin synthase catalytic subunit